MLKTVLWKPDTHDCAIELEWDDELPLEEIVHTPTRAWCDAEMTILHDNPQELYDEVLEFQRSRNLEEDG